MWTFASWDCVYFLVLDILEVNGLALDYTGHNVYWTDAQKRRIEMASYDGHHRRVVQDTDLFLPRGIVIDSTKGWALITSVVCLTKVVSRTVYTSLYIVRALPLVELAFCHVYSQFHIARITIHYESTFTVVVDH